MPTAIVRSKHETILSDISLALDLAGYRPDRNDVFIKPNIGFGAVPEKAATTDPLLIEALIRYLKDYGKNIVVGEGCIVGSNPDNVFRRSGYMDLAGRYGIELVDLDKAERVAVEWPHGVLKLPAYIRTHEYINVPKMKTHIQTGVSLGLKNQKGLLLPSDKKQFHNKGRLNDMIRDLSALVKPDLTIMDAILALEGNGPGIHGKPKLMNLILAGRDHIEVDNAALRIMGFSSDIAPHIPVRLDMDIVGISIQEATSKFLFDYQNVLNVDDGYAFYTTDACSGCFLTLSRAVLRDRQNTSLWKKLLRRFGKRTVRAFILGHAHNVLHGLPSEPEHVTCIGDCARQFSEIHCVRHISGCPPRDEDIDLT